MYASLFRGSKLQLAALSGAVALALVAGSAQADISQSGERKNINRLGHTDLQGRSSYQPNVIQYPDGRTILFAGMHSTIPVPAGGCPAGTLPNPLNGGACEASGTMLIDVTDPANPVEKFHIPATPGGQSTMVRMCLGSVLPGGQAGKVYMLRGVQGGPSAGYEQWDVTNVSAPVRLKALTGLRSTHKDWWECNTGIAFMPGSKDPAAFAGTPVWRQSQAMLIFDWSNPHNGQPPVYIRTFGLPGGEPTGTGAVPNSLHGPISAHEHPRASQQLARGASATNDIIGNRIYAAWGVGDDGVMTIIDRKKLLPFIDDGHGGNKGGTWVPAGPNSADSPLETELIGPTSPTVGYYLMSPDQGGHTSRPYFTLRPASFARFSEFLTRDIVVMTSEATANTANGRCTDAPHVGFVVDVTVENSITAPPGTRVEHDPYQGPMGLATLFVQPQFGERYRAGTIAPAPYASAPTPPRRTSTTRSTAS